jgi:hypothetical protein
MAGAAVEFIFAFLPALGVSGKVDLSAVPAALTGIDIILALHAEERIAEADIVPIGIATLAGIHPGAGGERQAAESNE